MQIHYYWMDKNSKKKGEGKKANNYHLLVDYEKKVMKYYVDCNGANESVKNNVEIAKKSDLNPYIYYLELHGYHRVY